VNEPAGDPFEALGDANRREIVEMLRGGGRSVREIADALPISRPAVSRHLRLLKEAGLVTEQPQGTRRIYRLDDQGIEALENYITQVWGDTVMRFRMMAENTRSLSPLPGATPPPTPGRTASRSPRQVSSTKRRDPG
jgi:DNA-binding transcriptional ArsR family regulator